MDAACMYVGQSPPWLRQKKKGSWYVDREARIKAIDPVWLCFYINGLHALEI
jgi:hypothetical protein